MNREELKTLLPHREPMLLVDEVELQEDGSSKGYYVIKGDEFFLQGHFPGNPIVPGVMLCEMVAQSASIIFADDLKGNIPVFTGINKVKFRVQVKPGDKVCLHSWLIREKKPFYVVGGEATVNEKLCMSGEFSFALVAR